LKKFSVFSLSFQKKRVSNFFLKTETERCDYLLSFQRLLTRFGHVSRIPDSSIFADGQNTLFAVRTKNEGENFRNRVVEFPASIGFFERTIGTTTELLIDITRADFAPMLPRNLFTNLAFPFLVLSASSAIQSAVGNQLRIVFDFSVHFTSI